MDLLLTNYGDQIVRSSADYPLESESETVSDHRVVCLEALLERKKAFSWEVHHYLKVTRGGDEKFGALMREEDWNSVLSLAPNNHLMAAEFHAVLKKYLEDCYVRKRVRRKSSDKPWISDGLRHKMKQRKGIFKREGRSDKWKRLDRASYKKDSEL